MSTRVPRSMVGALALMLLLALPAAAYEGEVSVQVDVAGPARAVCPAAVSATVTVVSKDGSPVPGVVVTWSTGETGTTDASGQHTIVVNLTGDLEVSAAAEGAVGHLLIDCVSGDVLGAVGGPPSAGLPRTDTVPPGDPELSGFALLALGLLATALGVFRAVLVRRGRSVRPADG